MRNLINLEKFIKMIVMSILSLLMIYAVASGKLQNYVNPRMNVVVLITSVILLLIVVFTLPDLKRKKHTVFVKDYIILLVPVFLSCVVPCNIDNSNNQINLESTLKSQSANVKNDKKKDDKSAGKQETKIDNPMVKNGQTLEVSDKDFARIYLRISGDMDFYEGQKIKMKGQFFKTEDLSKTEFVLARMAMVCCAADVQPCGFLCKCRDTEKYKTDQWLTVTGTIHVEEYQGEKMPVIHAEVIENAEAAEDKYIYFNRE